jgi:hypothetical protein
MTRVAPSLLDAAFAVLERDERLATAGASLDERSRKLMRAHSVLRARALGEMTSGETEDALHALLRASVLPGP